MVAPKEILITKVQGDWLGKFYVVDTLTNDDPEELIRIGGHVVEVDEGVMYEDKFKLNPLRNWFNEMFDLNSSVSKQRESIRDLVKLKLNSLCGLTVRKYKNHRLE